MAKREGVMYSRLGDHLRELKTAENLRPESQRRPVPTVVELAELVGVHPNTMNDYANGHVVRYNLHMGSKVLRELKRRGFDTTVTDLIGYVELEVPDEEEEARD
jgi:hypothetical protein